MDKIITVAAARLDDAADMARFLAPIPNAEGLAALLRAHETISTRAYDDATQTARFVVSDGKITRCFTVEDLTIDQAEMIAATSEEMHAWDESTFRLAVEEALGNAFDRE
jgi:hypothetical protein